jgi:uncharacterized protein (TIGR02647 family)
MSFNNNLTNELNLLSQFNLSNEQDGIKIHQDAASEVIAAAEKLHDKGLITQVDGGYLTDLGRKAAEHTQALSFILK